MKLLLACLLAAFAPVNSPQGAELAGATILSDAPTKAPEAPDPSPRAASAKSASYEAINGAALPGAVVKTFTLAWGDREQTAQGEARWLTLRGTKANGETYQVWLLTAGYPAESLAAARRQILRFILQSGSAIPREFRNRATDKAALPSIGGWLDLFPRPSNPSEGVGWKSFPQQTRLLGHAYRLTGDRDPLFAAVPPTSKLIQLQPDLLVGVASNTRQRDPTRRYDGSDYELVRLSRENLQEMADAGMTCLKVDAEQLPWIEDLNVFYWGMSGKELAYPDCLYDSRYLGPTLFLDEPAVSTRDHVLRPRLAKDASFRKAISPQMGFDAFREYFAHAWKEGAATSFTQSLSARPDVALGDMHFLQANLFSWETMVSTSAYQLSQDPDVPSAMVFEPPGRVGTRRTLPELDMTYGCQIPLGDPNSFIDIIYGFLRGAARLTGKEWGTSIYGAVERADAFWYLTRAYDLGATRFFFWDNAQLACVPYPECLALARSLKMRAENYPRRDLEKLRGAAEVAILLPAGYNLGHVFLGKGNLWGLSELNLERTNTSGIRYREVMNHVFTEIERCLRLGIAFDLFGEFPGIRVEGYREVVRIREDGNVELLQNGQRAVLDTCRIPARPPGAPPQLTVDLPVTSGKVPLALTARARVVETTAPVFYTFGADPEGIYHNAVVAWELYGPEEEDHRFLTSPRLKPQVLQTGKTNEVLTHFQLERPGHYRLRAAVVDAAGRSTVVWVPLTATE